ILERQRRILHNTRQAILFDQASLPFNPESFGFDTTRITASESHKLQKLYKKVALMAINRLWMDYLDEMETVREGIHLVAIGSKNPVDEFSRIAIETFDKLLENLENECMEDFREAMKHPEDIESLGHFGPSSTFTYLLEDSFESNNPILQMCKMFTTLISEPLFTVRGLLEKLKRRWGKKALRNAEN
ncbi:MAG: hypothetical protein N2376_02745, partial [Clostridia bacterium]|nr:hypothetical protein [Clostridia bacterium]